MTMTRRIIVYLGFGLAFLFLLGCCAVGVLFIVPTLNFGGMVSVAERNSYTRYSDLTIKAMLDYKNIIIESQDIDIEIRVRKPEQLDAGTIVVFEDATGIAFNSVNRTLIDLLEHVDDDGVVYHRIIISEPQGAVSRHGYVYINLYANDTLDEGETHEAYNFILKTGRSHVVFAADNSDEVDYLYINTLAISGATGVVSLPTPITANPFFVDVGNLTVNSSRLTLTNKVAIRNNVHIQCDNGSFTFGNIGVEHEGEGNVTIAGERNAFHANNILGNITANGTNNSIGAADVSGNVYFNCVTGSINLGNCDELNVETVDASSTVGKCSIVNYTATGTGGISVNQVDGMSTVKTGKGAIALRKAYGKVVAESNTGSISIEYASDILSPGQTVFPGASVTTIDGSVSLTNVVGTIVVTMRAGGRATTTARFLRVTQRNVIEYVGSTRPSGNNGNITVVMPSNINRCNLTVYGTAQAKNSTNLFETKDMRNNTTYYVSGGDGDNVVDVYTSNKFELKN